MDSRMFILELMHQNPLAYLDPIDVGSLSRNRLIRTSKLLHSGAKLAGCARKLRGVLNLEASVFWAGLFLYRSETKMDRQGHKRYRGIICLHCELYVHSCSLN
jgi:hypothetical protein